MPISPLDRRHTCATTRGENHEIKFVFKGGTNFDPKVDMHVHEGYMKIADDKTINATFVVFNAGKPGHAMSATLTRKDAK